MDENRLIIGTRRSALALRQTEIVAQLLRELEPGLQIQMETFHTTGDRILEKPLQEFGGKGVFVTELEQAILEGRVDLAVHSAKDMPMELEKGLEIVGVPKRESSGCAGDQERRLPGRLSSGPFSDFWRENLPVRTEASNRNLQPQKKASD